MTHRVKRGRNTSAQVDILDALRQLRDSGHRQIRANQVAEILWPDARAHNANGQTFNLASGIAGRMLRKCRAVHEVGGGEWWIVKEFLE